MKKLILIALALIVSFTTIAQVTKVSSPTSVNPTEFIYEKDEFTDKETLTVKKGLVISNDGKKGLVLYPVFKKVDGIWTYNGFAGGSNVGTCFENDKIYILFEDGTKMDLTSWRKFNCKGDIGFDLYGTMREKLSQPIKGIKFQNGQDYSSFEKMLVEQNDKNYFVNVFNALDEYNKTKSSN